MLMPGSKFNASRHPADSRPIPMRPRGWATPSRHMLRRRALDGTQSCACCDTALAPPTNRGRPSPTCADCRVERRRMLRQAFEKNRQRKPRKPTLRDRPLILEATRADTATPPSAEARDNGGNATRRGLAPDAEQDQLHADSAAATTAAVHQSDGPEVRVVVRTVETLPPRLIAALSHLAQAAGRAPKGYASTYERTWQGQLLEVALGIGRWNAERLAAEGRQTDRR